MRLRWLETVCYMLGAVLLCSYGGARALIAWHSDSAVREFQQPERRDVGVHGHVLRFGRARTDDWSAGRLAAHRAAAGGAMPSAVLLIPAVGLEVPVYDGVTELNLNRGAARIAGTAGFTGNGNLGLAAHRDGYFRSLQSLQKGDRIELLTLDGRRQYRVTRLSVVKPQAVEVLDPTAQPTLTLVTCYPFHMVGPAPNRFIVQATAVARTSQQVALP